MNYVQDWLNLRAKQCEEMELRAEKAQALRDLGETCQSCVYCIELTQCKLYKREADKLCADFERVKPCLMHELLAK